jgi:hypothetical protein
MRYVIVFLLLLNSISNYAQQEHELIHFKSKKSIKYFKNNMCIVGQVDVKYNLWFDNKSTSNEIALKEVHSNFASDTVDLLFLKYQIDSTLSQFIRKNPSFFYYFNPNYENGSYRMVGYSLSPIQFPKNKIKSSPVELIDFTNYPDSLLQEGEYTVGGIDFSFQDTYPLLYQAGIMLNYPRDLKLKEMNLYGAYFKLKSPLSIEMIHAINEAGANQIVLKEDNGIYEIVGFVNH